MLHDAERQAHLDDVARLDRVGFRREGRLILDDIDLTIRRGEHWVAIGPNGSGKTTLAKILTIDEHPSEGEVTVLGERLGRCDVRTLRRRIGWSSPAVAARLRLSLSVRETVLCGRRAALEPWWHTYDADDEVATRSALERTETTHLAGQRLERCSAGELQRVLLARALVNDPAFLVLDEPAAALDLGHREDLVGTLDTLFDQKLSSVHVTHHLEEIPSATTHCLLLDQGQVRSQGPIVDVLTSEAVSDLFERPLAVSHEDGRWSARRR